MAVKDAAYENMVLRSVYLPADLDHRIGAVAFTESVSKGDVIREMVVAGLIASGKETLAERLAKGASARKAAAKKKAGVKRALRTKAASTRSASAGAPVVKKVTKKSTKKAAKKTAARR